jgi:hypothetical protein
MSARTATALNDEMRLDHGSLDQPMRLVFVRSGEAKGRNPRLDFDEVCRVD